MSTKITRPTQRARRSQVFAVVLLVFLYVAQPALALFGAGCGGSDCGSASSDCCCEGPEEAATLPTSGESCCSTSPSVPDASKEANTHGLASPEACDCQSDSNPLPEPALPPGKSDSKACESPADWVRMHAEQFASIALELPGRAAPPGGVSGMAGGLAFGPHSSTPQASSASAWALLTRGIQGLLALLSLARN